MDDPYLGVLMILLLFVPPFAYQLALALRRLDCPDCGGPLLGIQSPFTKTWRQWVEGGYLCRNCGCETDLAGKKVAPGTGPRPGWFVRSVLPVALLAIVAVVLLFIGRQLAMQPFPPAPSLAAPMPAEPGR